MAQYTTIENGYTESDKFKTFEQISGRRGLPIQAFKLKLNSEKGNLYDPGDAIDGKVFLKNDEDLGCLGIAVCLEGFASVSYKSGSVLRKRVEKLLPPSLYGWTTVFLVGCLEDYTRFNGRFHKIDAGEHIIPFQISTAKLNPFAGTYTGSSGDVNYRVIACVIIKVKDMSRIPTTRKDFKFVEQSIAFRSYLNLETLPLTKDPVSVGNGNKSFLSSKKINSEFNLSRSGFLPGEIISFTLKVSNPLGKNVSKFSASLICKLAFLSDISSRVNTNVVECVEKTEIEFGEDGNTAWTDFIGIPTDVYPSITGQVIQHQYSVKIEIFTAEKESPVVKSTVPITIGSVREDESLSIENRPLSRSMSLMSISSNNGSFESLPPSYSELFSSGSRKPSTETLPPRYEDCD